MTRFFELMPTDGRKSFYGKAVVAIDENGVETLYSYNTPIISKQPDGQLIAIYDGWSLTTGRHIKAFCGLDKKQWTDLQQAQLV